MITFLAHAERLMIDEWLEILVRARELGVQRLAAVRRLRDTIAMNEPTVVGMLANTRIAAIAHALEQELREQDGEAVGVAHFATAVVVQLTAASYAIERCNELSTADVAQLYAPFETCVPLAMLG